jgi:ATP-dependent Clp protease adaptor protein ClpS
MQAEQCTTIAHYRGKCPIKSGSLSELKPIYNEMVNRKIVVELK